MNLQASELIRLIRTLILRWKIRSLDAQAQNIIEARSTALRRLIEIRRERDLMQGRL